MEGLVAVVSGLIAGSISLVGFGMDSFIEVTSGSVLLWRMSVDANVRDRERNEKRALMVVGICFLALAAYIAYESAKDLWFKLSSRAQHSRHRSCVRLPCCDASPLSRETEGGTLPRQRCDARGRKAD